MVPSQGHFKSKHLKTSLIRECRKGGGKGERKKKKERESNFTALQRSQNSWEDHNKKTLRLNLNRDTQQQKLETYSQEGVLLLELAPDILLFRD